MKLSDFTDSQGPFFQSFRKTFLWVHAVAAILAVGYAFGRWQAPTKTVEVDRIVERVVTVEDTRAREQVRELTAQLETLKTRTRSEQRTVERPDGTRETTVIVDHAVDRVADTRVTVDTTRDEQTSTRTDATREVVRERLIERAAPQWFAGVLVVANPLDLGSLSAGVTVGRHIVGPLALGLSLTVPVKQPVQIPFVGLSLTLGF